MEKNSYQRHELKKNHLKNIIFRLDYQGVVNVDRLLEKFNQQFKNRFKRYEEIFQNQISINIENPNESFQAAPSSEIKKHSVHRYSDSHGWNDNVALEISKYFSTISIECKNYKGFDNYEKLITEFLDFIFRNNDFLSITRVGLRKISSNTFRKIEDGFADFEKSFFYSDVYDLTNGKLFNSNKFDLIGFDDGAQINFMRRIDVGVNSLNERIYQFVIDIDGFYHNTFKNSETNNPNSIAKMITELNSEPMFKLFKACVTNSFLEGCKTSLDSASLK